MTETAPTAEEKADRLAQRLGGEPDPQPGEPGGETPPEPKGEKPSQPDGQKPSSPPPWGDEFDAQRAWTTIQSLREEVRDLRAEKTEHERAQMSELDRTKAERDDLKRQLEEAQGEALRHRIAASKGLPTDAAGFLTGSTQEELERSADKLKRMIGDKQPQVADFGAGARPNGNADSEDFNATLRRAAGRPA